jgi:hypothetical protein
MPIILWPLAINMAYMRRYLNVMSWPCMTIQVAAANAHGVAMASDRHVYRDGHPLSTARRQKLSRLRGPVPAALMCAGRFSVVGFPVSRMALRFERALATAAGSGPEALAEAALGVLSHPLGIQGGKPDEEALAETAELVVARALAYGGTAAAFSRLLDEIRSAPRHHASGEVEAMGRRAWRSVAGSLAASPPMADALRMVPDLLGEAVVGALVSGWARPADVNVMLGLCCPVTGVPVLVAVKVWSGLSGRLMFAPRRGKPFHAMHASAQGILLCQGSGSGNVSAMIGGVDHPEGQADRNWRRAQGQISVSTPAEMVSVAAGLVRGAEVIGYLTGGQEGSVDEVDALLLTPQGVEEVTTAHAGRHGGNNGNLPAGAAWTPARCRLSSQRRCGFPGDA